MQNKNNTNDKYIVYNLAFRLLLKKAREIIFANSNGNYREFVHNKTKQDLLKNALEAELNNLHWKGFEFKVLCNEENNPPRIDETNTLNITLYSFIKGAEKTMFDYRTFVLPRDFQLLDEANESFGVMSDGKCGEYEMVDHPTHYNNYSVEVIDMMEKIWGTEATIKWCEMTAFKYRMRVGTKPDNSVEQDLKKEQWYLDKAEELRKKM